MTIIFPKLEELSALTPLGLNQADKSSEIQNFRVSGIIAVIPSVSNFQVSGVIAVKM